MLLKLIWKELRARPGSALATMAAIMVSVALPCTTVLVLRLYAARMQDERQHDEVEFRRVASELGQAMRKATLKLSFNLVILPRDQNLHDWYAEDFAEKTMPEEWVERLADSGIVTVRHFLPSLQRRIDWTEQKRSIILIGTRGEVPNLHKNPVKPLVQPVPDGCIVLGHELHSGLDLGEGDHVVLLGRAFRVHRCHEQRGNKDDVTAWIPLEAAQELLGLPGQINAILALECMCAGDNALDRVRGEVAEILPGVQVVERGSSALARYEARTAASETARQTLERDQQTRAMMQQNRERLSAILVAGSVPVCAIWIAWLAWQNVRKRRIELATLVAVGYRRMHVLALLLGRAVLLSVGGAIDGLILSSLIALVFARSIGVEAGIAAPGAQVIAGGLLGAAALASMASWIPALAAVLTDPARILSDH